MPPHSGPSGCASREMPPPPSRALLAAIVLALLLLLVVAAHGHGDADPGMAACTVEDDEACAGQGEEELMARSTRRELGGGGYIGYDALRRNAVPCSYRGASYYNCRPGGQANPYSRGCSSITRCRG
ncbi:protein RALF-like 33 [Brachypodium distachyon]|uniref:Rapid alkalinization factor 1 n=1 Tax=Brachypodium distachyon TaxID=15368 RepID=A0A2K2DGX1_BRADI|nr:protein RALF-like 33 [Brachypodium distachyon]PNT73526.1 hypothetical protein BRADI_2g59802v3 [Brachypodium distachyon]|eukprot:XP_003567435.1 protein RALF-like 33 [Brachypodium distachyon]